ncbi:uncharacterized protein BHQ10_003617 [Talaromyces amestolkiae]|uniref:Enoyl reductase (ER) domain-containing protein n=1 Tax=Talaromyces amestolkiae TaxID=1196081 RepID=A0A364KVM2_TALAM|nr:uncharacterized protein BHQ10_003617 [Talaromyces amestolkiae]RAO67605.1 hypothetical protein BHQ10_003617 [Talaromyces amestolkiae]
MDLPQFHQAVVLKERGNGIQFEVIELPLPELGPADVLIKRSVTGLCGTDFALASGALGETRRILGHEGIGRIVKLGSLLDESQAKIGQRVGVSWVRDVCGSCAFCLHDGGEAHCVKQIHSGRKVDGTLAGFTVVPSTYIIKLPEGPSDQILAPIMCAGVTAYKALKICNATPGSWVVLVGAGGGVGSLGIQYAREMGYRVIAVDAGSNRKEFCLSLGANAYVDIEQEGDVPAVVRKLTDKQGARAAIVCAGSSSAYQDALQMVAPFGTLVCVGITPVSQQIQFHPLTLIDNGIRIVGSMVGTRGDVLEAVEFVRRGQVFPSVQMVSLAEVTDVAKLQALNKINAKLVVSLW